MVGTVPIFSANLQPSLIFKLCLLQDFLDNFQVAQEKLVEASQAAAEVAKLNVQEAYTNAAKAELSLDLKV